MIDKIKPLIIKTDQSMIDVVYTNTKGFKKSIENDILWIIHPETQRLLPYSEKADFLSLTEDENCYIAKVSTDFQQDSSLSCAKLVETVQNYNHDGDLQDSKQNNSQQDSTLLKLEAVIKKRYQEMPEGSYTTHLFKSGGEKIRKKTGEEAIELLLASKPEEIVYESADLIYHMMVLLQSEGISITQTLKELEKRG